MKIIDLQDENGLNFDSKVADLIDKGIRHPFDLSIDLLLRGTLLRLNDCEHVLLISSHHIAWDHWSIGLFFGELSALYRAFAAAKPSPLAELPIQYKGIQYQYGFCSTDPDGDNITICVNWGDGSGDEYIGPFSSGVCGTAKHIWSKQGTYVIKAKASDGQAESDWSTLEVTMPMNKIIHTLYIQRFCERFSNTFSILRLFLNYKRVLPSFFQFFTSFKKSLILILFEIFICYPKI